MTSLPTSSSLTGDPLTDDPAVMGDDLEIEARHQDARVAVADRCLADVAEAAAEREVAAFDVSWRVGPSMVSVTTYTNAASPSSLARRNVGRSDPTTVPIRSARMSCAWSSSAPARKLGVAGDVGDQQAGGLLSAQHRWRPSLAAPSSALCCGSVVPFTTNAEPRAPRITIRRDDQVDLVPAADPTTDSDALAHPRLLLVAVPG